MIGMRGLMPATNTSIHGLEDPIGETRRLMEEFLADLDAGRAPRDKLDRIRVVAEAACAANSRVWHSDARAAQREREEQRKADLAAEHAARLADAIAGPPEPPAEGTDEAMALYAIAMEAYAGELKGQTGQFSINMARRCGWEAMLAHYRRHERPSVGRAQAERRLEEMGLGDWAWWG